MHLRRRRANPVRWLATATALVGVSALVAACGGDAAEGEGDQAASGGAKKRVFVLMPSLSNQAYVRQNDAVKAQAAKETEAEVTVDSPGTGIGEANQLIPKLEAALTKGVDAIAINGGAAQKELIPVLERAAKEGVKIVTFDADIPDLEGKVSFVNVDEMTASPLAGEFVKEQLPDGGELFYLSCIPDHPVTVARTEGFEAGLEGWKGKLVGTGDSQCDEAKARTIMENAITAHPNLDVVYTTTEQAAAGGIAALRAAKKDLLFVSHDAAKEHVELVANGDILDGDVLNPFEEIGAAAVRTAVDAALGKTVEPEVLIKGGFLTKDNAQEYLDGLKG
jgi:ABC-type sugar transport system substrate-binding protein